MTIPASLPPGSTQDPDRPHVYWYPRTGERLVIDAAQYARHDSRDARIAELETALRAIRSVAGDNLIMEADTDDIFDAIHTLATNALAGADPEPSGVTVEVMAI